MSTESPGVIYLEVDEDITSAIDKLTKAAGDRVQVVTAKRSTLFQSVINLKLLHKAAKDAKKSLVLVTSDRVATNLAGRLGVPVATQVGEAAQVPTAASVAAALAADDEIDGGSVGALPKDPDAPANPLESAEASPAAATPTPPPPPAADPKPPKPAKAHGQRVPNIGKMQKRILWGVAAVVVIGGLFGLSYFLTSANVTLYAQASQVNARFNFIADPTATQSSPSTGTLSAQQLTVTKTLNAQATASGTKDDGSPASGTMTVSNCYDNSPHTLVSGTRFESSSGLIFTSTQDVTVPGGTGSFFGCTTPGTATVPVQAAANGSNYNLGSGTKYTIPGLPAAQQSGITGQGGQMQGGVTKVDKVVMQSDVNQAEQSALGADKPTGSQAVEAKAGSSQTVLAPSVAQTASSVSSNPSVGSEADSATVTIQVTYTVLAVQKSALSALAQSQESQQLGSQSQIYDDGSSDLQLSTVGAATSSGAQKFSANATAYAGTKIDTASLAKQLKGQKYGDAVQTAGQVSGVTKATVTISPSWESSMPHISSHIHVQIKVSNTSG